MYRYDMCKCVSYFQLFQILSLVFLLLLFLNLYSVVEMNDESHNKIPHISIDEMYCSVLKGHEIG